MFSRFLLPALAVACCGIASAQGAPSVDDVVAKHIAALGGVDKIRAIKTSKTTGKMILGGGQMEATMVAYARRPAQRMEITMQGQKIVQAFDGTTAWMINPMMGGGEPQRMPADEAKAAAADADADGSPLIDFKAKGNKVELQGKEDVEGAMAYKLRITLKSGNATTLLIDEKSYLPVKTITKRKQMGQEVELEAYTSNYKAVDGVMMPFNSEIRVGGRTMMQSVIDKVETNVPVDDAMFAFPGREAAPPRQ
jgi:outer membrane lipoprotein-sorting protein